MWAEVTYSEEIDSLYIVLRRKTRAGKLFTERVGDDLYADFDLNDKLVGLEVLSAADHFSKAACRAMARHTERRKPAKRKGK